MPPTTKKKKVGLPELDEFLLYIQTQKYSPETIYNYERDLHVFEDFLSEHSLPFSDVDKKIVNRYKAYLNSVDRKTASGEAAETEMSAGSMNRHLSSLRSYLKYLIDMDEPCPIAPDAIKLVKMDKKHPRVPDLHELIKVIEAPTHLENNEITAARNRAMLELLFATGMRISELISLNRGQIDDTGRVFIKGKGRKERFAYLTPRAISHLKKYLSMRSDDAPALFIPLRGRNTKAGSGTKKRISANYLQAKIKSYRERLKINVPISAHTLRHGFATYLAEEGANPAAIQILLGHESLDTTTRYVHASDRYAEKTHYDFHPLRDND